MNKVTMFRVACKLPKVELLSSNNEIATKYRRIQNMVRATPAGLHMIEVNPKTISEQALEDMEPFLTEHGKAFLATMLERTR